MPKPDDRTMLIAAATIWAALYTTTIKSTFGKREAESLRQRALAEAEELRLATARRKMR